MQVNDISQRCNINDIPQCRSEGMELVAKLQPRPPGYFASMTAAGMTVTYCKTDSNSSEKRSDTRNVCNDVRMYSKYETLSWISDLL